MTLVVPSPPRRRTRWARRPPGARLLAAAVALLLALALLGFVLSRRARASGPMRREVYVWQRAWTGEVRQAVRDSGEAFTGASILAAEGRFEGESLRAVRVGYDAGAAREGARAGLSIRLSTYAGSFAPDSEATKAVVALARSVVDEARAKGLEPSELQIDFDCPASRLDGYALWLSAVAREVAPLPVAPTTLPSWLSRPAFARLVEASTGPFVLQVHALERPRGPGDRASLFDARAARRAVEAAGSMGKRFRVALPTYAYDLAFDDQGRLVGLSAEGPLADVPAGARVERLEADPAEVAALVRDLLDDRPASLEGLLWYRLPVRGDRANWSLAQLSAVASGRAPRASLRARLERPSPGLYELWVDNQGDGDGGAIEAGLSVSGPALGSDTLAGFSAVEAGPGRVKARGRAPLAGERRKVLWLRAPEGARVAIDDDSGA